MKINKDDLKELRTLFNAKKKIIKESFNVGGLLDSKIYKLFKYHYSDKNIDAIIDVLDYGYGDIDFDVFLELMINNQQDD